MASSAQIRKFLWRDLDQFTHLFNEVSGIATSEQAYDVEYMRQFLSQPSCNPEEHCYLVESQHSLVGFVMIAAETPIRRAVASGGVLRSHRNRGIGRRLVRTATEHARGLKASVLHIQASSNAPDARHILESEGFHAAKTYLQLRWQGDKVPDGELPKGFSLRLFRLDQDEEALTRLQNESFGQNWGFCPNTVEEISARVRLKRCEPEGIIFVVDDVRLSAYNWTFWVSAEAGSTGWIAMTGVHPDYRGQGLGRAAVVAGMEYLKVQKRVEGIELEVDSENAPAMEIYRELGFKAVHRTTWYEKWPGAASNPGQFGQAGLGAQTQGVG